jgi:cell division septum initiation protein DivIVA
MKNEFINQLSTLKKDLGTKSKKKEQESRSEVDKLLDDTKANRDKIQKLAVQFDKELADRDKQISGLRQNMLGEI